MQIDFHQHFASDIWFRTAVTLCQKHKIQYNQIQRTKQGEHIVFLLDNSYVLKIYHNERNNFAREKRSLETAKTSLPIPQIIACGEVEGFEYLITTQIQGIQMTRDFWLNLDRKEQISILNQLAIGLKELHSQTFPNDGWLKFIETQKTLYFQRQIKGNVNEEILRVLPEYIETNLNLLQANCDSVFLHGDVHFGNLRLQQQNGHWKISGLFDFADSLAGSHEYDFLAIGVLMIQGQGDLQREFFRAYGSTDSDINENLRKRLMLLTIFYECSDLRRYALRLKPEAVDWSLDELERGIWSF